MDEPRGLQQYERALPQLFASVWLYIASTVKTTGLSPAYSAGVTFFGPSSDVIAAVRRGTPHAAWSMLVGWAGSRPVQERNDFWNTAPVTNKRNRFVRVMLELPTGRPSWPKLPGARCWTHHHTMT